MITIKVSRNFNLRKDAVKKAVSLVYNSVSDSYLDFLKKYPTQKNPETTYKRGYGRIGAKVQTSEDLGARWTKKISLQNLTLEIGNNASYAPYVQSSELQAEFHKDWWQTDQDAINEYEPLMFEYMSRLITDYVVE